MEKNKPAIIINRASRRALVLVIALAALSAQQSWAAACQCESHSKLTAKASQSRHGGEESTERHHSACHNNTRDGEAPKGLHHSGDEDEDSSSPISPAIPNNPTATVSSGAGAVSCCCMVQASPPDVSPLSFLTQQPTPVEVAQTAPVGGISLAAVSIDIHRPPRCARSRPLYIVQSSLLI